jgi:hypothetical protein
MHAGLKRVSGFVPLLASTMAKSPGFTQGGGMMELPAEWSVVMQLPL